MARRIPTSRVRSDTDIIIVLTIPMAFLFGILLALLLSAAEAREAAGIVCEDRDGDGVRDADEPGLPGVAVQLPASVLRGPV